MQEEKKESNPEQAGRIVLAIDLDYFFAQCEEIRSPDLKLKPVVVCVYSGRTDTSGAVSTANYAARNLGVRSGMPIYLAMRILKDQKDAVFLPLDTPYYETVSESVMDILRKVSPRFEQVSIDEAFLDVSELSEDYEKAAALAGEIKEEIRKEANLSCTIGVAKNKLLAKMAVDASKPDGLKVIPEEQVRGFLKDLPANELIGIGPKISKKLSSTLGIRTIGELASAPREDLSRIFGAKLGPELKQMANGLDEREVEEKSPQQLSRIITLKSDATGFSFQEEIPPLARSIGERLDNMNLEYGNVGIIVITNELKTRNLAKTLEAPTSSVETIVKESSDLFKKFFLENPNTKARRIGIKVSRLSERNKKKEAEIPNQEESPLTDFF